MTRADFVARREPDWLTLQAILDDLEQRPRLRRRAAVNDALLLPDLYRAVCEDLALARYRGYGPPVVARLNRLALRAYHRLYSTRTSALSHALAFLTAGFPRLVRREAGVVLVAACLFFGPFLALTAAGKLAPEWVHAALSAELQAQLDGSFSGPPDDATFGRSSESDLMMFGLYIRNNVGIDFRTFAGGILFGLGSVFFLLFNGIALGAAFGYCFEQGYQETFLAFTAGHGGPELLALVISGAAGLRLGLALLRPGRRPRARALQEDGRVALRLALGAGAMTTLAAVIEAFWSATAVSPELKYGVGIAVWCATLSWLLFAGRRHAG